MEEWYQSVCICCACDVTSSPKQFTCELCEKEFKYVCALKCHVKTVHNVQIFRNSRLLCPEKNCLYVPDWWEDLRKHISKFHMKLEDQKDLKFSNMKEFEQWKKEEEAETRSYFRKLRTDVSSVTSLKKYYVCYRSGKAKLKSKKSCRIGATCPATINVQILRNGEVTVQYYKTHFGHTDTVVELKKKLNLVDLDPAIEERAKRRKGLGQACTNHRNSITSRCENRTLNFLVKKYFNITQTVSLNSEHWDQNDAISVKNWVSSLIFSEDNPVVLYKSADTEMGILQKEDFILVLMDRCQICLLKVLGMNGKICIDLAKDRNVSYFSLMTVLVSDRFGSSFPVAFCLSNRNDAEVIQVFFKAIKKHTGYIHANVFMSPDDPVYYNEWKSVMGKEADHVLICFWDIDERWRIKLGKIRSSASKSKRAEIYRAARVLLEEKDADTFHELQTHFIDTLLNDDEIKDFGAYFKNAFSEKVQSWAYHCRKLIVDVNTNTHLEAMHCILKHIYFNSKRLKRIDKCILTLLQFIRDVEFDHVIKISDETTACALRDIYISHKESVSIPETYVEEVEYNQKWLVKSVSESNTSYEVKREVESCDVENCNLVCEVCQVCMCYFSCTCINYTIQNNMCKHIHRVITLFQQSLVSSLSIRFTNFRSRFDKMFTEGVIFQNSQRSENNLISSETPHKSIHKSKIPSESVHKSKMSNNVPSGSIHECKVSNVILPQKYISPKCNVISIIHKSKMYNKVPSVNVHKYKMSNTVPSENVQEYKMSNTVPSKSVCEYKMTNKVPSESVHECKVSNEVLPQRYISQRSNIISKLQYILSIVMSTTLPLELETNVAEDVNGIVSKLNGDSSLGTQKTTKKRKLQ